MRSQYNPSNRDKFFILAVSLLTLMTINGFPSGPLSELGGKDDRSAVFEQRPTVVEIFTSQNNTSASETEKILADLARRKDVLPLTFHIGHWDQAEWKDTFAGQDQTQRYTGYVSALRPANGPYVPQAVVDGIAEGAATSIERLNQLIQDSGPTSVKVPVSVSPALPGSYGISIDAPSKQYEDTVRAMAKIDIWLFIVKRQAQLEIGAGPNQGKTLTEPNVVRQVLRIGEWNRRAATFPLRLSSSSPDADGVVILLQERIVGAQGATGPGRIIGAASFSLHQEKEKTAPQPVGGSESSPANGSTPNTEREREAPQSGEPAADPENVPEP